MRRAMRENQGGEEQGREREGFRRTKRDKKDTTLQNPAVQGSVNRRINRIVAVKAQD